MSSPGLRRLDTAADSASYSLLSTQQQRMAWTTLTALQCIIYHPIITSCASSQEFSGFSRIWSIASGTARLRCNTL